MLCNNCRYCHVWNNNHDWNYTSSYAADNTEIVLWVGLRTKREPGQDIWEYNLWWEVDSIPKIDQHKDHHDSSYYVRDPSVHPLLWRTNVSKILTCVYVVCTDGVLHWHAHLSWWRLVWNCWSSLPMDVTVFAVCSFQYDHFNTVSFGPVRTFYVAVGLSTTI